MFLSAKKSTCPFCRMMHRAKRNALIGMSLAGSLIFAAIFTYQSLAGV